MSVPNIDCYLKQISSWRIYLITHVNIILHETQDVVVVLVVVSEVLDVELLLLVVTDVVLVDVVVDVVVVTTKSIHVVVYSFTF